MAHLQQAFNKFEFSLGNLDTDIFGLEGKFREWVDVFFHPDMWTSFSVHY